MRRAAKIDANQTEIVEALRAVGASVQSLATVGGGCPDIAVGWRGKVWLIEIKDRSRFTPAQKKWHRDWQGKAYVANDANEALEIIGAVV